MHLGFHVDNMSSTLCGGAVQLMGLKFFYAKSHDQRLVCYLYFMNSMSTFSRAPQLKGSLNIIQPMMRSRREIVLAKIYRQRPYKLMEKLSL